MALPKFKRLFLLFAFELALAPLAGAQEFTSQPLDYAQRELWFDEIVGSENTGLINGPEYFIAFQGGPTNPFFGSLELSDNQLWFDQAYYPKVQLMYDIYTDMLVVRHRDKNGIFSMIALDQSKIEGFTLHNHHFRKLTNRKSLGGHVDNGYYDILYTGKHVMVAAKRMKVETQTTSRVEYKADDRYYFIRDNQWVSLGGLSSISGLMKENANEIKAFAKSNKINLKKRNEQEMKAIANFCDTLLSARSPRQ